MRGGVLTAAAMDSESEVNGERRCPFCAATSHPSEAPDDHAGLTALHASVQSDGHLDVVIALLENGADADCRTAKGNTPLMYAAAGGHTECVKVLLSYGCDVNARTTSDGDTPLHKAVREGHVEVIPLLVAASADPDIKNRATGVMRGGILPGLQTPT